MPKTFMSRHRLWGPGALSSTTGSPGSVMSMNAEPALCPKMAISRPKGEV
ncbi:MAG: hypothetical protein ACKPBU_12270 [Alphaproteobacteria bacterium]